MKVIGWRIYYGDGSVVDSRDRQWDAAPSENVAVVVVFFDATYKIWRNGKHETDNYRQVLHTQDYYWKVGDEYGCTKAPNVPVDASVKLGKMLEKETWLSIYNRANNDYRF